MQIPSLDDRAREEALRQLDGLVKPVGALGRLEQLAAWLCAAHGEVPPRPLEDVRVVVFAGDHGVSASGAVSAYPRHLTAAMVRVFLAGGSGVNVLAREIGARVRVLDLAVDDPLGDVPDEVRRHKIRRSSGPIDVADALEPGQARRAFDAGIAAADADIGDGADLLIPGDMGIGNTTIASALVAAVLGLPAEDVVGAGTGVDDDGRARKIAVLEKALARANTEDPFATLTSLGSACAAATAGLLVRAAERKVPVVLDGVFPCAAAVVAREIAPGAEQWWVAGHRSTEPAQAFALKALGLEPILDLGLRLGEGSGAVQAVPILRNARAVLTSMGRLADLG